MNRDAWFLNVARCPYADRLSELWFSWPYVIESPLATRWNIDQICCAQRTSQQSLPPTDIVPGIKFPSDLPVDANRLETHSFVQSDACLVWQCDARKSSVITQVRRGREQLGI